MHPTLARSLMVALAVTALACSEGGESAAEATRDLAALSAGKVAAGDACGRFTTKEIERHVGAPVRVMGETTGGGCAWEGTNDDDVYVAILVSRQVNGWERPHGVRGYEELPGMGRSAHVVPEMGGWRAGVLTDNGFAIVTMSGGASSRERAIGLLRDAMQQL
jgi:hypothetical protein